MASSSGPCSGEAGPSRLDANTKNHSKDTDVVAGSEEELYGLTSGLDSGLDAAGFAGPEGKTVKPLTAEALAAFQAAQNRTGVVYISRIPPGMRPAKVRHLMSAYGEIGRVYLQQEGIL